MNEQPAIKPQKKNHMIRYILITLLLAFIVYAILVIVSSKQKPTQDLLSGIADTYNTKSTGLTNSAVPRQLGNYNVVINDAAFLGSKSARVTIVEFGDFECPFTKETVPILKNLQTLFGDRILIEYRNFPIVEKHSRAYDAALAAECALEQGNERFWAYHDRLFQFQDALSSSAFAPIAQQIGLNESAFSACFSSKKYAEKVQKDFNDGVDAGVQGTPTFFINGKKVTGVIPEDVFVNVINQLLQ